MFFNPQNNSDIAPPAPEATIPNTGSKTAIKIKQKQNPGKFGAPAMPPDFYLGGNNPWTGVSGPTQADIGEATDSSLKVPELQLPEKPSGIGGYSGAKSDAKQTDSSSERRTIGMSPEEYQRRTDMMYASKPIQDQLDSINKMSAMGRGLVSGMPARTDISPILQYLDSITGQKQAQNYKAPISTMDKAQQIFNINDEEAKRRQDVSKDVMNNMSKLNEGFTQQGLINQFAQQTQAGIKPPVANPMGTDLKVIGAVQKLSQDYNTKDTILQQAQDAVASGNFDTISRSISVIARAIALDKGKITNFEIAKAFPNTGGWDYAKLNAYLSSDPGKQVLKSVLGHLPEEIKASRDRLRSEYEMNRSQYLGALKASSVGTRPVDAMVGAFENPVSHAPTTPVQSKQSQDIAKILGGF